jgi:hypothetical protein
MKWAIPDVAWYDFSDNRGVFEVFNVLFESTRPLVVNAVVIAGKLYFLASLSGSEVTQ